VVKRRFVSDGRLMMAQVMHAFLSACIYRKRCIGKDGEAPNDFLFFRGVRSILLKRLEDSSFDELVLRAVRLYKEGGERSGPALLISRAGSNRRQFGDERRTCGCYPCVTYRRSLRGMDCAVAHAGHPVAAYLGARYRGVREEAAY
jgi:hypothetical protein